MKKKFDRIQSGIGGLDEIIEGGFIQGSTNLISGMTGTCKTIFGAQFLYHGLKKGENGVWQVTLELAPGKYLYKFVVDGATWKEDPENPDKVADPYGGFNSVLTVE